MSILVTGGADYIGSHMVHELADAGEGVIALDNLSTGFDWAVTEDVPFVVGDTGDQNLVGQIICEHNVDSIIHFAASYALAWEQKLRRTVERKWGTSRYCAVLNAHDSETDFG